MSRFNLLVLFSLMLLAAGLMAGASWVLAGMTAAVATDPLPWAGTFATAVAWTSLLSSVVLRRVGRWTASAIDMLWEIPLLSWIMWPVIAAPALAPVLADPDAAARLTAVVTMLTGWMPVPADLMPPALSAEEGSRLLGHYIGATVLGRICARFALWAVGFDHSPSGNHGSGFMQIATRCSKETPHG